MSKRDTILLLDDMLQSCLKIKEYTKDIDFEEFQNNEMVIDAVVRNFEIIGEAANHVDQDFREQNPEIEWNRRRGFRNRIIHEYFGVDNEIVWTIIVSYLDELINWLEMVIEHYDEST